jgi:thiol:disulfide interchange protein DsbD
MNKSIALCLALFGFLAPAIADTHAQATLFVRKDGRDLRAAIEIDVDRGWHAYHGPTKKDMGPDDAIGNPTIVHMTGAGAKWGDVRYPTPKRIEQEYGGDDKPTWIYSHEGKFVLYVRGELDPGAKGDDIGAQVDGLTCEDKGSCVPFKFELTSSGSGSDTLFAKFPGDLKSMPSAATGNGAATGPESATTTPANPATTSGASKTIDYDAVKFAEYKPQAEPQAHNLAVWLLLAFVAGVILNFMPCVLPVVSIKVLSFVQQAGESRSRILSLGLSFAAGIMVVFVALAALAAFAGKGWGEQFQDPRFIVVMIAIVFAFSLSMFDVFEIGVPSQVGALAGGIQKEGLGDAFFKGIMATVLATPCSGPFLGSTLAWAVTQQTLTIFLVFLTIGLGMAAPYVVLTANPAALKLVPKPGAWMQTFKQGMGFLLLATVVYLMTSLRSDLLIFTIAFLLFVALGCWWWGKFATFDQKLGARLSTLGVVLAFVLIGARISFVDMRNLFAGSSADRLAWVEFDPELLAKYHKDGRNVFVDFTANWCPNCKYNEVSVYDSDEIRALVKKKDVVAMKADITNDSERTEMIRRLMAKLGARSIPVCAVFPGDRPLQPYVRLDIVTVSTMKEIFEACPDPKTSQAASTGSSGSSTR